MRSRWRAFVVVSALLLVGCGGGSTSAPTTTSEPTSTIATTASTSSTSTTVEPTTTTIAVAPIAWQPYAADPTLQEGWVTVPIDRAASTAGSIRLHVVKRPATDTAHRIGALFVNPGGPGDPGIWLAVRASTMYSAALLARFDIVAWDPRGTGTSTPAIDCITDADYDHFFAGADITPDAPEERQQLVDRALELATDCATKNAIIIQHVGTNDSAQDMDAIRRAIGEERVSYFGWSYGSTLGAVWATMFPATVRAAVFDGAGDPTIDFTEGDLVQAAGFEQTLDTFLARCSADATCAFHNDGHAEKAFDQLMSSLDAQPIPTATGRPALTREMALTGVIEAMYVPSWWPNLAGALRDAQQGEGEWLLAFWDRYYGRADDGSMTNTPEAFQTIECMDTPTRLAVAESDATSASFRSVAPRTRPGTTGDYFCSFFPVPEQPRIVITGVGAGPILVVANTDDPATPLAGAQAMAAALEHGVLLTVEADGHTAYTTNTCAKAAIDAYLLTLTLPAAGTVCH